MPNNHTPEMAKTPDNIVEKTLDGTTYIIHEFFDGKKTLDEIIKQRILNEMANAVNPSISDPIIG